MQGGRGKRRWFASGVLSALIFGVASSPAGAEDPRAPRFVPGELLVRFEQQADARDRRAALASVDARTLERLLVPGLRLVEVGEGSVPGAAATLERGPEVRYAEPNYIDELLATPNDPDFGIQWALDNTGQDVNGPAPGGAGTEDADIDAVQAWNRGTGSDNVILGIADTGVAYGHPTCLRTPTATRAKAAAARRPT